MKKNKGNRGPQPTQTIEVERPSNIDNGNEARGSVNARENQTRTQPEPSPAMTAIGSGAAAEAVAENIVAMRPPKGQRRTLFERHAIEVSETITRKIESVSEARQRLAEAVDLYRAGADRENEAREAADRASLLLYQARVSGAMSAEELSGLLGDTFGWKAKKDGTNSKTPDGKGEMLRKRIVRAVQAHEFVTSGDGGSFFERLEHDEVQSTLNKLDQGEIGIWRVYDILAETKRKHDAEFRTHAAFNPKSIGAITEKLCEDGAAQMFVNNPALVASYVSLMAAIRAVDEEATRLSVKAA